MDEMDLKQVYQALADEIRLRILKLLYDHGELCVCQLLPILKISQPNLSFHLRVLRDAGLVKTKKKKKWIFYFLNKENEILKSNINFIKNLNSYGKPAPVLCDTE